ncbi:MAG: hypothetical protein J6Q89_06545 [Clostridia bacterium]|nr:hypothetical protein [Clostridia bacterium]
MNNRLIRLLALALCMFMLSGSLTCLTAFADTSDESGEPEKEWEEVWKEVKQPAYTTTAFSSVKERILGSGAIEPMQLYAVINGYAFYGDALTGEMIFLVLKDDTLTKDAIIESKTIPEYSAFYCTNPYNAGAAKAIGQDKTADATEKQKLLSQIIIKYAENDKDSQMDSFADAAANQQINIKNIRGGVRVEYTIGREEVIYLVPRLIKKEKLEALRDQVTENSLLSRDAKTLMAFYTLKDLNDATLSKKSREEMEKDYPITKQFAVYVCEPTISTQELLRLEKIVKSYTNYDYDTLEADHSETEYVSSDEVPPLFKLALEYRVDGEEITIRVNAGNIRFNSSIYKLSDVLVLPYGGAGDVNNSGYLFSPDGSGSLIDFSDLDAQFTNANSLYGQDYAYHTVSGQNREVARLPVFGVYQRVEKDSKKIEIQEVIDPETNEPMYDDEGNVITQEVEVDVPLEIAYLAVIEEGDSLAKINVNYGGRVHNYASIYTSFNPRPKDSYVLDGGISAGTDAMWTVESKRKYTGDFKLRLFILDGTEDGDEPTSVFDADKSYSDMAAVYRDYLVRTGVLSEIKDLEDNIPLYIETLGAIQSTKKVLGVPVETMVALTTFQDTIDILEELKNDHGIDNVKVKMNAWMNGGMMGEIATSIDIEKVLGGKDGFKKLVEYAKNNGVTLFPDIELSVAYWDKSFDGFKSDEDVSQSIDERISFYKEYDPVFQAFVKGNGAVISPYFMKELYDSAYEDYKEFDVGSISVSSIGKYLSSDFNVDNPLTREDSKELVIQLLQKISENHEKILVSAGNEYTLRYATDILDVPMDDSRLLYSYATIPFMSMVLHGYKEFAGTALNLAGDYNYHLLKTIECGASPYFVIAANNTSVLKEYTITEIAQYYSVRYSIWLEDIKTAYNEINSALSDVQKSVIKKHEIITDDGKVVKVVYENGITFFMNYGEKPFEVEGTDITVPVNGYVKLASNGEIVNVWEGVQ